MGPSGTIELKERLVDPMNLFRGLRVLALLGAVALLPVQTSVAKEHGGKERGGREHAGKELTKPGVPGPRGPKRAREASQSPHGFEKGKKKGWKGESHPPGWEKGKKKGWEGGSKPPGQRRE